MKADWTKGVNGDPEGLEERKTLVKTSSKILKVIREIMEKKQRDYMATPRPGLDDSSWALRMADANGYLRALKEIIELTTPDPED